MLMRFVFRARNAAATRFVPRHQTFFDDSPTSHVFSVDKTQPNRARQRLFSTAPKRTRRVVKDKSREPAVQTAQETPNVSPQHTLLLSIQWITSENGYKKDKDAISKEIMQLYPPDNSTALFCALHGLRDIDQDFQAINHLPKHLENVLRESYLLFAFAQVCGAGGQAQVTGGSSLSQQDLLVQSILCTKESSTSSMQHPPNIEACLALAEQLYTSGREVTIGSQRFSAIQLLLDAIDQLVESKAQYEPSPERNSLIKRLYRTAGVLLSPGASEPSPKGSYYSRLELLGKAMRMDPPTGEDFNNVACELTTGMSVPYKTGRAGHELLLQYGINHGSCMAGVNLVDFLEDKLELPQKVAVLTRAAAVDPHNPLPLIRLFEHTKNDITIEIDGQVYSRDRLRSQALQLGDKYVKTPRLHDSLAYRQGDLALQMFVRDELRRVLAVKQ